MKINFLDNLKTLTFKDADTNETVTLNNQCVVGTSQGKIVVAESTDDEVMGQKTVVFLDNIISLEK